MWERVICFIIMVLAALCTFAATQEFEPKTYCLYGDACWPSKEVFDQLQADYPTMTIIRKGALGWEEASDLVLNRRVAKTPGATIYVTSVSDIIAVVNFTKFYNMDLKLISSGHEFIGRNTAEGCLQMSLAKMTDTSIDLSCQENSAGCMTAEPGVLWLQAYREVDVVNRIILGGAEPTVSVTGWSLGGGHSPYSPKLGLGADHIIELSMVLADLSLVTMNKDGMVKRLSNGTTTSSDETDLFWAVRGGGGGTFGVVTLIKFRLHMPPTKFATYTCAYGAISKPKKSMKDITQGMKSVMDDLPEEFGGYLFTGALCYTLYPSCEMAVYATYAIMHYGAVSENQASFDKLKDKADDLSEYLLTGPCTTTEYLTYYDYVRTLDNVTHQSVDMDGVFFSKDEYSEDYLKKEATFLAGAFSAKKTFGATWIRLGGQTMNDSSGATAINPLFRNAMWTVAYGGPPGLLDKYHKILKKTITIKGQYYSECEDDLPPGEWQTQFWGDNTYSRLLTIKRKYDPDNHFTCKQCVGSDANQFTASVAVMLLFLLLWLA